MMPTNFEDASTSIVLATVGVTSTYKYAAGQWGQQYMLL
jgi:hypothetical protein